MLDDGDDDASFAALGPLVAEGQSATMIAGAGPSTSAPVVRANPDDRRRPTSDGPIMMSSTAWPRSANRTYCKL